MASKSIVLFDDDVTSLTLGELTIENGTRYVSFYLTGGLSLDVASDEGGRVVLQEMMNGIREMPEAQGIGAEFGRAICRQAEEAKKEVEALIAEALMRPVQKKSSEGETPIIGVADNPFG
jgi:hypothetical protein